MHYRCVILVIASRSQPYSQFRELWQQHWDAKASILHDCLIFYLYNEPGVKKQSGQDLIFPHDETYPFPGLLLKTLDGMQALADANITYDLLCRTNLSSMYDWSVFRRFVDEIADGHTYYGGRKYGEKMVSGCAMFMSADVVRNLLNNRAQLSLTVPDDVAMNTFIHDYMPNVNYGDISSASPTSRDEICKCITQGILHYRFYTSPDRQLDVSMMKAFVESCGDHLKHEIVRASKDLKNEHMMTLIVCSLCISCMLLMRFSWRIR